MPSKQTNNPEVVKLLDRDIKVCINEKYITQWGYLLSLSDDVEDFLS